MINAYWWWQGGLERWVLTLVWSEGGVDQCRELPEFGGSL